MRLFLTYSYSRNQYELIKSPDGTIDKDKSEILHEFEAAEWFVAEKIFLNLNRERFFSETIQLQERRVA
ncbi:MAG: hypothetical protein ACJA08_002685 [Cyclobacteriaceae bacterium]|jgi:hypothetical protein